MGVSISTMLTVITCFTKESVKSGRIGLISRNLRAAHCRTSDLLLSNQPRAAVSPRGCGGGWRRLRTRRANTIPNTRLEDQTHQSISLWDVSSSALITTPFSMLSSVPAAQWVITFNFYNFPLIRFQLFLFFFFLNLITFNISPSLSWYNE